MPGHARDRVVEDYHRRGRIVVRYIHKPRDSGVHERGVADHADALTRARAAVGFIESVKSGYRRTHAERGIKRIERLLRAERIAADIAEHRYLILCEGIEKSAMRTSGAHHRRTHGDCGIRRHGVGQSFAERLRHGSLRKFADGREHILAARDLYAVCAAEVFDDPVELFDDIKLFNGIGKIVDKLFGQGIDDTELQHRSAVAEHLTHILIACTGRYDADFVVGSAFNAVERAFGGKFRDRRGARFDLGVLLLRVSGHHYVFLRILHIIL